MDFDPILMNDDVHRANRKSGRVIGAALATALFAFGCTPSNESSATKTPIQGTRASDSAPLIESVALIPADPTSEDVLTAIVRAPRRANMPVAVEIDWIVNGKTIVENGPESLPPRQFARGDRVIVVAWARHGEEQEDVASPEIIIGNAPPVIRTAMVDPQAPTTLDTIQGQAVGEDTDGDPIEFEWRWYRNEILISGPSSDVLLPGIASKGDTFVAEVRAFDGYAHSEWVRTREFSIQNSAPTIRLDADFVRDSDGVYRAKMVAEDPDEDRDLRFQLRRGPKGMHVDSLSGVLSWEPQEEAQSSYAVEVSVSDTEGAESILNFVATIDVSVDETPANGASVQ